MTIGKKIKASDKNEKDRIYTTIFALYVGTGPVYWMPGINPENFYLLKSALFFLTVCYPLLFTLRLKEKSKLFMPGGSATTLLMSSFLILTTANSLNGIENGNIDAATSDVARALQIPIFIYACGFAIRRGIAKEVATKSVIIITLLCTISYGYMVFYPSYTNPLNDLLTIENTGLGGSRTGWSPSIALYLPWAYSSGLFSIASSLAIAAAIALNQISVAGRTGLTSSLIPLLTWAIISKKAKITFFSILSVAAASYYILNNKENLRLSHGGVSDLSSLNELSTGRLEQYEVALLAIAEKPLQGHGSGALFYNGTDWLVHNTLLKLTVEGGVFYGLTASAIILLPLIRSINRARNDRFILAALLTVIAGIATSLFEPGVMFGAFNQISFWWLCFSICVTKGGLDAGQK